MVKSKKEPRQRLVSKNGKVTYEKRSYEKLPKTNAMIERFLMLGNSKGDGTFSKYSMHQYKTALDDFFYVVKKEYDKVTVDDLDEFQIYLKKYYGKKNTINGKKIAIKAFFRFLYVRKKIDFNPTTGIFKTGNRNIKETANTIRKEIFSKDEINKLLDVAKNPRDHCLLSMMYGMGLRIGEVSRLKVDDVDLVNNKVRIMGKDNRPRDCAIKDCLKWRIELWLVNRPPNAKSDYFFVSKYGGQLYQNRIRELFHNYVKIAGLNDKKRTPHSLRHSMVTHAIEDGVSVPIVQEFVGHSNVETTMLYTHVADMESNQYLTKFRDF